MIREKLSTSRTLFYTVLARLFTRGILHRLFKSASVSRNLLATFDVIEFAHQTPIQTLLPGEKIGIVVQGPINKEFTHNICTFIINTYPNIRVVVSTWEDEDTTGLDSLHVQNLKIIKSPKPKANGPSNINLQIVSTISGIKFLEKIGCTHILKIRSDTFLGNPQFINYLIWMLNRGKSHALVFSSFNSFLFRLYSVTDQIMFGNTKNMLLYWNIELNSTANSVDFPEKFLFKRYLKLHDFDPAETFDSYLKALSEFTVIADHEQLGQVWNKGTYTALGYRWRGSTFPHSMSPLTTWLWEVIKKDDSYIRDLYQQLS
jgi:hypothetical protein